MFKYTFLVERVLVVSGPTEDWCHDGLTPRTLQADRSFFCRSSLEKLRYGVRKKQIWGETKVLTDEQSHGLPVRQNLAQKQITPSTSFFRKPRHSETVSVKRAAPVVAGADRGNTGLIVKDSHRRIHPESNKAPTPLADQ